jgi:hypothetical protein
LTSNFIIPDKIEESDFTMASTGVPSYSGPAAPGAVPAVKNNSSHDHNGTTEKSRKRHSLRHPSENSIQSHLVASAGEFVGTFMFLYIAYMGHIMATNHVSPPPTPVDPTPGEQSVLIIAVAYGFSLLVNVWAFYRISGGLFNPAVSPSRPTTPLSSECLCFPIASAC